MADEAEELDRLGECLTDDATWDGSVFGFDPVVGLDAIAAVLSGPGHAKAHHTTNIVVSEGPGDEVRVRSKGLGLFGGRRRRQRRLRGRTATHR